MKHLAHYCVLPMFASAAILVNHTIDDVYGDSSTGLFPIYSPSDKWAVGSMCTTCSIFPGNLGFNGPGLAAAEVDVTQAFMQTWHDSTYLGGPPVNVSVYFVGQAVYVYNIIANAVPDITTNTSLVFALDGTVVGAYTYSPDPAGPKLLYNVPVYVNSSLPPGEHVLTISAGSTEWSLILFDYIVYTTEEPELSSPLPVTGIHSPIPGVATFTPFTRPSGSTIYGSSVSSPGPTGKHPLTSPESPPLTVCLIHPTERLCALASHLSTLQLPRHQRTARG